MPDKDKKGDKVTEIHNAPRAVTLRLDGANFSTLKGFYDEVEQNTFRRPLRERSLVGLGEMLDELVRENGAVSIGWVNSGKSRLDLGYPETIRQLQSELETCHPSVQEQAEADLDLALEGKGPTVFTWLTETMAARKDVTVMFE